jgi:cobalamin biosynthesis protein CobT
VDTAQSDGQTITFPVLKQPITEEQLATLHGYVIHECGHNVRPEAFKILNSAQPPSHVCAIYNIVEDDGMERERANEWRGDKKALSGMNSILVDQVSESWERAAADPEVDITKQPAEPLATMAIGRLASLVWDVDNDVVTERCIRSLPPQAQALTKELSDEGWVQRFRDTVTPSDTWDLTIDLVKRLYPDHDEQQYEEMRQDGHDKSDPNNQGRDKASDQKVGHSGKDTGGEDSDGTDGTLQDVPNAGDREEDGRVVSWKDVVISEHNEWQELDGKPGGFGIDWTGAASVGGAVLMPTSLVSVVDLSKGEGPYHHRTDSTCWKNYMPTDAHNKAFANRIRRYIQARARSVVDKEKYHGKLDRSGLVRLALPPIEGGEYNKRIFYDQRKHTMKDTAIFVLTDWSGSMIGNKMKYAADASQRLVHTFDRVLNVPVALAAFSNCYTQCDIGYIKKYNTRGLPAEEIAKRFNDFREYCAANNDADSLNWAWKEILKRKETRKILMVLSDGCPAGSWGGSSYTNLRYMTKTIEQDGRVELYGIGICSDAVEDYYTNSKVVHKPEHINDVLFNIIKDGNNVK